MKFNTEINRTIYPARRSNETEENEKSHFLFETRSLRPLAFTELYKTPQVMVLPSHRLNSLASSGMFQAFSSVQCGVPWVPETFLARFPVSVKSFVPPTAEDVSAFGQHRKFPPHARKTSGTQGKCGGN